MARQRLYQSGPLPVALVGGILLALSGEPWSLNFAGFLSLIALVEAFERGARAPRPVLANSVTGLVFGSTANAIALYSLGDLLQHFGGFSPLLAWPMATLAFAGQGLPYAVMGLLAELCVRRGLPRWLAFPPALVLAMWLSPTLFPWRPAAPQVDFAWFVQMADLGGEALIDICMAWIAAGLWQALRSPERSLRGRLRPLAVALVALAVPCAYGGLRLPQVERARNAAPMVRLGVVQSNVGIQLKHDPERAAQVLTDLKRMTAELESQGTDLTVWAETAYPYALLRSRGAQPDDERRIVGQGLRGPVLIGAVTYLERANVQTKYNTAWLLRENGRFGDRVDKSRLLAFGEYVPLWDYLPPLQERFPSRGFEAGENDVIRTEVPGGSDRARGRQVRYGILICYEDLFADLARKVVQRGADVLLNMTNDAWFGDSHEPALHNMVARLRAIETRRDLVRAVNTGVSSFTTATGKSPVQTRTFTRASFIAEVRPLTEITVYSAWGDWLPPLVGLLLLATLFRIHYRHAKQGASGSIR